MNKELVWRGIEMIIPNQYLRRVMGTDTPQANLKALGLQKIVSAKTEICAGLTPIGRRVSAAILSRDAGECTLLGAA